MGTGRGTNIFLLAGGSGRGSAALYEQLSDEDGFLGQVSLPPPEALTRTVMEEVFLKSLTAARLFHLAVVQKGRMQGMYFD